MAKSRRKRNAKRSARRAAKRRAKEKQQEGQSSKPSFNVETLEPRILLSGTWVDADTGDAIGGATEGNDSYTGTDGADTADALGGADTLDGGAGDDVLSGGAGDDTLFGGLGDDTLDGGSDTDTADYSGAGAGVTVDLSAGTATGDGNDTLTNIENVTGSDHDDTLVGDAGDNVLAGGAGDDQLDGGAGSDTADFSDATGPVNVDLHAGTATGDGSDTLTNIENATGSAYDDTITGDSGDNVLAGGAGDDTLTGGAGADTLSGQAGDDTIAGGAGDDSLDGGAGTDTADYSAAGSGVNVDLDAGTATGDGSDTLTSIENVTGSANADTITGDAGDNVLAGGAGDDTLDGGAGADTVDYSAAGSGVNVDLNAGTATGDGSDTLANIENVTGSANADTITGDAGDNVLVGGAGDDVLSGSAGADTISGLDGDDMLTGGADDDVIDGGAGTDTVDYSSAESAVTVDLTTGTVTGGAGNDTLSNVEKVIGSAHDDTFSFSAPTAGVTYSVEGGGGSNTIDLTTVDRSSASFTNGRITVDTGGGQTFSIDHANVHTVRFTSTTVNFVIWDGGAAGANWSDLANWSTDALPGADDILLFNGTSDSDASFDAGFPDTVGGILIDSGYAGTISMADDLTVTNEFVQEGGTVDTGANALNIEGDLVVGGGSLTIGGNCEVTGHITQTGGSVDASAGQLTLVGGSTSVDVTASFVVGDLEVDMISNADLTLTSDLTVTGDLTITEIDQINGGAIVVSGNVTSNDSNVSDSSTGTITLAGGADQVLSGGGVEGNLPSLTIAKTGGTVTVTDAVTVDGDLNVDGANVSGTLILDGNTKTMEVSASNSVENLEIRMNSSADLTVVGDAAVTGDLTISEVDRVNGGSIVVSGDVTSTDSGVSDSSTGTITLTGGADQTLSGGGVEGDLPGLTIAKTGGTVTVADAITVDGDLTVDGADVDGTIVLGGNSSVVDVSASNTLDNLEIDMNSSADLTINGDAAVTGDLTIAQVDQINGGSISVSGDVTSNDSGVSDSSTGTIKLTGSADQVLSGGGVEGDLPNLNITKTGGSVTVTQAIFVDGDLTVDGADVDGTILLGGPGKTLDVAASNSLGNLEIRMNSSADLTLSRDVTVDGDLTFTQLRSFQGGAFYVNGDVTHPTASLVRDNNGMIVVAGSGDEILTGEGLDDKLRGSAGDDTIDGGAGTDTVDYGDATSGVTVDLEAGTATGGGGTDTITNVENVTGSQYGDTITGDGGANVLEGAGGDDRLAGGEGDDTLSGGAGSDVADYTASNAGVNVDLAAGTATGQGSDTLSDIEHVDGSQHDDTITGTDSSNTLQGMDGADTISAGAGDDTVSGGAGDDVLDGGAGTDTLSYSGTGSGVNVNLATGSASGEGNDTLSNFENVTGSQHDDIITGDANANLLRGNDGNDTISAGAGDDTIYGGSGDDAIDGGAGDDHLSYSESSSSVNVNLDAGTATGEGSDTISNVERVTGSQYADTLTGDGSANEFSGGSGDDTIDGGAGNDTLYGESGDDTLTGGAGDDTLDGGSGDDVLDGGAGDNVIDGGEGTDTADYSKAGSGVTVNLQTGEATGEGRDTLSNIENVVASAYGDSVTGDDTANVIDGGAGDDTLEGAAGNDQLLGGAGDDTLDGGSGDDTLIAGTGDDVLRGGTGSDHADYSSAASGVSVNVVEVNAPASSPAGVDTLTGIEQITGSQHDDTFAFEAAASGAVYTIDGGGGTDTIDLSGYNLQDATFGSGSLTIDMGGAGTFTINYSNIESIRFADVTATVLDGDLNDTAYSGSGVYIDGGQAFRLEVTGPGTVDLSYSAATDTLTINDSDSTDTDTGVTITDLAGADLIIDSVAIDTDLGTLTSNVDIGTITISNEADISTLTIAGGDGTVDSLHYTGKINDPGVINANVNSLTADGDIGDDLTINGDVGQLTANTIIGQDAHITVDGSVNAVTATSYIRGDLTISGNLNTLQADYIGSASTIDVAGDVGTIQTTGGNLAGDVTVGGTLDTVIVADTVESTARIEVTGDLDDYQVGNHFNGDIIAHADLGSLTVSGVLKSKGGISVSGNLSTISCGDDYNSDLIVGGDLGTLTTGGKFRSLSSVVVTGNVDRISITDGLNGDIEVNGNLSDLDVGANYESKASLDVDGVLGTLHIGGDLNKDLALDGSVGTLTIDGSSSKDVTVAQDLNSFTVVDDFTGTLTADHVIGQFDLKDGGHEESHNFTNGTLIVYDGSTNALTADFAPTAQAGSDQTVDEGDVVTLDATGSSDPEGQAISYTWTQTGGPAVTLNDANTSQPTFTAPDCVSNSTLTFQVEVSDGTNSGVDTVTITVNADNDAPTAQAGIDQTVDEGDAVTLDATGSSDPEGQGLSYTWTQTGGPAVALNDANASQPTFTAPDCVSNSTLTFQVEVSDGTSTSVDTVTISVNADDDAPTAQAGNNQTVDEGDAVTLDATGSSDPEGQGLAYTWTQTGGTAVTLSDANASQPTFTAPEGLSNSTLTFQLEVSDGTSTSVDTVTITVNADNDAPTAQAGNNQTVDGGDAVTLDATGSSDPEGQGLSYTWTQTGGTAVTLNDANATQPTFTAPEGVINSTLTFQVEVSDGTNTSVDTVTITVNADAAPTAQAGNDQTVDEGDSVTLDATGSSDPEGQGLTYTWTQTGGPAVTLSDASASQPTFTAPEGLTNSSLTFQVEVSDGTSSSVDTVTISVNADNDAPTAQAGNNQTVDGGDAVTLDATGSSDPEGQGLGYTWTQTGGPAVTLNDANSSQPTFTAPEGVSNSTITFQVEVSDGTSSSVDTVTISVIADAAPTAQAGHDQTVDEGDSVTLDATGSSDPEGQGLTYTWTQTGGPAVTLSDANASQPTFTAPEGVSNSSLTFQVEVSDGTSSSIDTVTVSVNADDDAPTAQAGNDQTVDEGDSVTLDATGSSDPEGQGLTYTWTQTGGTAVTLNDANASQPTFTSPEGVSNSSVTFQVEVSDGTSTSVDTVTITVNADDDAPTAEAGNNQTVDEGHAVRLDATGSSDPEGQGLTYTWTQTGGPAVTLSDANASQPVFTAPDAASNSTLTFQVEVSDGTNTSVDTVIISVIADNAPTAQAGGDQTVDEGDVVTLDATGSSDPEGQGLTYTWTQTGGPAVTLNDANTPQPVFTAPEGLSNSTLTFAVEVSDGKNTSVDTVAVTVNADNDAPTANAGHNQTVDEGDAVTLDATGSSDPEGQALSYTWTQTGGPAVSLSDPGAQRPTFTAPEGVANDTLTFQVEVSDGTKTSVDTVTITVNADDDAPTARAGDSQTVGAGDVVTLDATGSSDPENQSLTYGWTQVDGPAVDLSDSSAAQPIFTAPDILEPTTLVFEVTVSDGHTAHTDTVQVLVSPQPEQEKVVPVDPLPVPEDAVAVNAGDAPTAPPDPPADAPPDAPTDEAPVTPLEVLEEPPGPDQSDPSTPVSDPAPDSDLAEPVVDDSPATPPVAPIEAIAPPAGTEPTTTSAVEEDASIDSEPAADASAEDDDQGLEILDPNKDFEGAVEIDVTPGATAEQVDVFAAIAGPDYATLETASGESVTAELEKEMSGPDINPLGGELPLVTQEVAAQGFDEVFGEAAAGAGDRSSEQGAADGDSQEQSDKEASLLADPQISDVERDLRASADRLAEQNARSGFFALLWGLIRGAGSTSRRSGGQDSGDERTKGHRRS